MTSTPREKQMIITPMAATIAAPLSECSVLVNKSLSWKRLRMLIFTFFTVLGHHRSGRLHNHKSYCGPSALSPQPLAHFWCAQLVRIFLHQPMKFLCFLLWDLTLSC